LTRFEVVWSDPAKAALRKLDPMVRRRIVAKVETAASNPARFAARLVGSPYCRIRIGDWRVFVDVDEGARRLVVLDLSHRRSAYR